MLKRASSTLSHLQDKSFKVIKGSQTTAHERCHLLQFDGGSNPNPGPSSAGAVIFSPGERIFVYEQGVFIDHASNNEAEYRALVLGLEAAKGLGIKYLLIEGDSQLVIEQIAGAFKMKSESLRPLYSSAQKLIVKDFEFIGIRHIYRENNTYADGITKYILQTKCSYIEEMASARRV
jgi:ribonuclease HI